ncbi:hypothetical protein PP747_gp020 [Rhizobium phage RHph_Y38]|uniref:Uncharacterized protein n=2 Tax=Acanvirus TaxID=3044653 RepID=A0A7S5QX38_9CAUD|nr:hypothetical protein PP747_gp020 [Rhizobium phage RHph_Y38]YP_010658232.1 hypothetical protein PP749_gp021 [Rhizobium phage RHEph22]QIG67721.1 hypothetical protein EVB52_020 [Rhizobium phage RHph_Y38]QXV74694.1 hypothetical protein [Rhizobium phage RHEph22]
MTCYRMDNLRRQEEDLEIRIRGLQKILAHNQELLMQALNDRAKLRVVINEEIQRKKS